MTGYQKPAPPTVGKGWRITKLVFYAIAIVLAVIVLALSIALAAIPSTRVAVAVWTAPQAVVSLVWSIAELITFCVRKGKAGIHPGAHVALHLLLWLGTLIGLGLNAYFFVALNVAEDYYNDYNDYYSSYDSYDSYDYDISYTDDGFNAMMLAMMVFMALLILIHFILFVRYCVETLHYNRAMKQGTAMVMMPPPQATHYHPQTAGPPGMQQQQQGPPPPNQYMMGNGYQPVSQGYNNMAPDMNQGGNMYQQPYDAPPPQHGGFQQQPPYAPYQPYQQQGMQSPVKGVESHTTGSSAGGFSGVGYQSPSPRPQGQQDEGMHPVGPPHHPGY